MKEFYDSVRRDFGLLTQKQVDGFNILLKATEGLPVRHRAYILATSWLETGRTMQPIHEYGARSYFSKYDAGTRKGKELGNTLPGDGFRFRGRGYVQLTGRANYHKASLATGRDLVSDPDKALEPDIAAQIIVKGMTQGWFTGKKMADCADYQDMRRVVNGTDKAAQIADYAMKFEKALKAVPVAIPDPVEPAKEPARKHWLVALVEAILSIFVRK